MLERDKKKYLVLEHLKPTSCVDLSQRRTYRNLMDLKALALLRHFVEHHVQSVSRKDKEEKEGEAGVSDDKVVREESDLHQSGRNDGLRRCIEHLA